MSKCTVIKSEWPDGVRLCGNGSGCYEPKSTVVNALHALQKLDRDEAPWETNDSVTLLRFEILQRFGFYPRKTHMLEALAVQRCLDARAATKAPF